ncbi:MAG: hypothetical protein KTR15_04800 [Phycisphaeraceae bacterium]|nr:hypothetical protein [Phycisphaeraceae bacterium]
MLYSKKVRDTMIGCLLAILAWPALAEQEPYPLTPPTAEQAAYYGLDAGFYRKSILVQGILIATSENVRDYALKESAYFFDKLWAPYWERLAKKYPDAVKK